MTESSKTTETLRENSSQEIIAVNTSPSGASAIGRMLLEKTLRSGRVVSFPSEGLVLTGVVLSENRAGESVDGKS